MAKMKIIEQPELYSGKCGYTDYCVYTETERCYGNSPIDNWFFDIDRISFKCTSWKEILTLDGYLPHIRWTPVPFLTVPPAVQGHSVIVDEQFDEAVRTTSESLSYEVVCDPKRKIIQILFGEAEPAHLVVVRPHENFLVGVDRERGMVLSTVLLLDVQGFPRLDQ